VTGASAEALRRIRAGTGFVFQQFNLLRRPTWRGRTPRSRVSDSPTPWWSCSGGSTTVLLVLVGLVMIVDLASSQLRARLV